MASRCPDTFTVQWNELVRHFGGDTNLAYYFYVANNEDMPDMFNREYNSLIKKVNNKFKLLDWKKGRSNPRVQGYVTEDLNNIREQILEDYTGQFNIAVVEGEVGTGYGLKITGWPIDKKVSAEYDTLLEETDKDFTLSKLQKGVQDSYFKQSHAAEVEYLELADKLGIPVDVISQYKADRSRYVISSGDTHYVIENNVKIGEYKANYRGNTLKVKSLIGKNISELQNYITEEAQKKGFEHIEFPERTLFDESYDHRAHTQEDGTILVDVNLQEPEDTAINNEVFEEQKRVLSAALPFVEILTDTSILKNGELKEGGKAIVVNPSLMSVDTLPHEYGHLLIDLRGGMTNKFIAKGREKLRGTELEQKVYERYNDYATSDDPVLREKYDKEVLAQAIGEQAAELMDGNWWNRFISWLSAKLGVSNNEIYNLAKELVSEKRIDPATFTAEASEFMQEQRVNLSNLTDPQDIADKIVEISNMVEFNRDEHTYTLNGVNMMPVSTVMGKYNYGINKEDENPTILRGAALGTVIHDNAENIAKGGESIIESGTGFTMSKKSKEDLVGLMNEVYGDDYIILAEVIIADPVSKIAGTVDVLGVDKVTGEIVMFDYKTKERVDKDGNYKGFKYYDSTTFGESQRTINTVQLSMYQHLIKKSLGLSIDERYIVQLVADVNSKGRIMGMDLERRFSPDSTGVQPISFNPVVKKMVKEQIKRNAEEEEFAREMADTYDISEEDIKENQEFLKNRAIMNKKLTGYEKVYDQAFESVLVKLREAQNKNNVATAESLKALSSKMRAAESKKGVLAFTIYAMDDIENMYQTYQGLIKRWNKGDTTAFTPEILSKWYEAMNGYKVLDDISSEFLKEMYQGDGSTAKKLQDNLRVAATKRNELETAYKELGKPVIIERLRSYSGRIKGAFVEEKQREWMKLPKEQKDKVTMQQYVDKALSENKAVLEERVDLMFDQELDEASEDIGLIARWMDNLLDSNDMVVSSMVKKYVIENGKVEKQNKILKDEMVEAVRNLETYYNYDISKPIESIYDFALEKDSKGKKTGHIISQFSSELIKAEDVMRKATEDLDDNEKKIKRRKWYKENMPLDTTSFDIALEEYIDELVDTNVMSVSDREAYKDNQDVPFEYRENDLKKVLPNNTDAVDFIIGWIASNVRVYRKPSSKWHSKQYKQLQTILKNPKDPRAVMYNLIRRIQLDSDGKTPATAQLDTKLPAILKTPKEIIQSKGGLKKAAKTGLDIGLKKRADDVELGVLTDETNKPLDTIPLHFQRKDNWTIEDQSFDLASVYYRYAKMSNHYENKSNLLSEMELVKLFVENRKYVETDFKGKPIQKILDTFKQRNLTKSGKNSMLAEQLTDWYKTELYGQSKAEEGDINLFGYKIDKVKAADLLGRYTSMNLLGLNLVQAVANVNLGEIQQTIESFTGEYFSTKDLIGATKTYMSNLPSMSADWGSRTSNNWVNKLVDQWDILNDYDSDDFSNNNKFAQNFNSSSLFALAHAGEHFMQVRTMLAMLSKVKAYTSTGKELGTMDKMYSIKDGKLVLDSKVNLEKSNWTEDQQIEFAQKVKRLLSRLHGEYSDVGKSAAQRYIIGRLGIMFRKFMYPGYKKRWDKLKYNEFLGSYTEGDYRNSSKFVGKLLKDLVALRTSVISEDWNNLLPREKANIIRGVSEVTLAISFGIVASIFLQAAGDTDDDQKKLMFNHLAYLTSRTRSELGFFLNPNETLNILKSPAASMSVIENSIKLLGQALPPSFEGFEEYETGNWKGRYKINKTLMKLTPGVKQYYRIRDIEDVVNIFNR
jgi:hypothetical protein